MRVRCSFAGKNFSLMLFGNPTARDLFAMLPLELTIEDYGQNEKMARLPAGLSERGAIRFEGERPGDLCYFAPWKTLAFFHGGYRYSPGLIRIGRLDGTIGPLLRRGRHDLSCEIDLRQSLSERVRC
jgi:hypothetical protein